MSSIHKIFWHEAKNILEQTEPSLLNVLSTLPDVETLHFYVASFDYGEYFGRRTQAMVPNENGEVYPISHKTVNAEVSRDLLYGETSAPLGLIINNYFEWHQEEKDGRLLPYSVQGPGTIFNVEVVFGEDNRIENNYLSACSGVLSASMLANIGCRQKHTVMRRELSLNQIEPKSPYDHYQVFAEIVRKAKPNWSAQILFFTDKFVKKVREDESWIKLKLFLSERYRKKILCKYHESLSEELILSAKRINRYRPTPFFIDTAKYIFRIFTGAALGVVPATDESCFPLKTIQTAYRDIYGLAYTPTIMIPQDLNDRNKSVYYPMTYPITKIDAFRTHTSRSAYKELEQLKDLLCAYHEEFLDKDNECYGSQLYEACQKSKLSYYHFRGEVNGNILSSKQIPEDDPRFTFSYARPGEFPYDAKLFRGCIRVIREPDAYPS